MNFQFWRPAGLQVPLEVDFKSQKRQKTSPFWTLNSTFSGSFFHYIFIKNSSSVLGTFWIDLGSNLELFLDSFGCHFLNLSWESDFSDFLHPFHDFGGLGGLKIILKSCWTCLKIILKKNSVLMSFCLRFWAHFKRLERLFWVQISKKITFKIWLEFWWFSGSLRRGRRGGFGASQGASLTPRN